jgi:hypothetical protein
LWTLTSKYEVQVSPVVEKAEVSNFELLELDGRPLREPARDIVLPHPKAIEWHKEKVWREE